MRTVFLFLLLTSAVIYADDSKRSSIELNGQVFVQKSSVSDALAQTEEYGIEGETADTWTQLVTLQRLAVSKGVTVEAFVEMLKKHIEASGDAKFRLVQKGPRGAVFGVHYRQRDTSPEQVGLVLVTASSAGDRMQIVQLMANPRRIDHEGLASIIQRLQARFISLAVPSTK